MSENQQMTKQIAPTQALNLVDQALSKVQGDRNTHVLLIQALQTLKTCVDFYDLHCENKADNLNQIETEKPKSFRK